MAKDKDVTQKINKKHQDHQHEPPIKVGDKFICPHCKAEIPMNQPCPTCKLDVDWTKI